MKPLVAVTAITRSIDVDLRDPQPNATVHRRFGELVAAAGGVPVFVAPDAVPSDLLEHLDAVIVNGGQDVGPASYGADPGPRMREVDPERDGFELELVRHARRERVPVLGICRGMHVVNVASGGTLVQHLPDRTDLAHECREDFDRSCHPVEIAADSIIARALGSPGGLNIDVNSVHHQAVDRLGGELAPIARSPDGVVEAVSDPTGAALGIQWHPEFLAPGHDPLFVLILERFLEACSPAGRA